LLAGDADIGWLGAGREDGGTARDDDIQHVRLS
jgi:hypothetical protein